MEKQRPWAFQHFTSHTYFFLLFHVHHHDERTNKQRTARQPLLSFWPSLLSPLLVSFSSVYSTLRQVCTSFFSCMTYSYTFSWLQPRVTVYYTVLYAVCIWAWVKPWRTASAQAVTFFRIIRSRNNENFTWGTLKRCSIERDSKTQTSRKANIKSIVS